MNNIKITVTGNDICHFCDGDGVVWPSNEAEKTGDNSKLVTCINCHGEGFREIKKEITLAEFRALMNAMEEEE